MDANNVSPTVYHNLIDTINKNMDKMHRYVRLRKKCLGVDELHMYDVYTPMIADAAKKISFEEAKETVLKALAPLGEEYVAKVKEGFESRGSMFMRTREREAELILQGLMVTSICAVKS